MEVRQIFWTSGKITFTLNVSKKGEDIANLSIVRFRQGIKMDRALIGIYENRSLTK